jgi:hypothetical protein
MKEIFRVLGLVGVALLFIGAGIALFVYWSAPHWARLVALVSGPLLGGFAVNLLRGKAREMFWLSERKTR